VLWHCENQDDTASIVERPNNEQCPEDFHDMLIVKMPCKENDPNKKISEPYMNPHSAQRNDEIRASEHNPSLEKILSVLCSFASFDCEFVLKG
jgi:hypothetical protein